MASTASVVIGGSVVGLAEGTFTISETLTNSTSLVVISQVTIGTSGIAGATTFAVPANARYVLINGPGAAGSSSVLRVAASSIPTSAGALAISSTAPSLLSVCTTAGGSTLNTTICVWTTGTVSTVSPTRLTFF